MGLYLRKSFRAGPIRFNVSGRGIGVSGGVKGARVGVGPRGAYVSGGRGGLYYRKYMTSATSRRASGNRTDSSAPILVIVGATLLGLALLGWLAQYPTVLITGIVVAIAVPLAKWWLVWRRRKRLSAFKKLLDVAFVVADAQPSIEVLSEIKEQQQRLAKNRATKQQMVGIEQDVYQAVLDRVLGDGVVTDAEASKIASVEEVLTLSQEVRLTMKKEIFSAAYLEAIEDRQITNKESERLENLLEGLAIPRAEVQHELNIVQEIIDTQALALPLAPIARETLAVSIQKNEEAFYECPAQVLSQRQARGSATGHEYTVKRDGTMLVTNKRVLVVGDGTTNIRYSDIADLEVDIDEGHIEISKKASGRPMFLKLASPIYAGRLIDLLMTA